MYTSFWNLSAKEAGYLHKYIGSACYYDQTDSPYPESEFWAGLCANSFTAVNGNIVMLRSGHSFVEPPVTESQSAFQKLNNMLINIISNKDSLLGLVQRISSLAGSCARTAEYLRMRRKCREGFRKFLRSQQIQSGNWAIPSIMEGPLKYNESKVYDSIENLFFIKKYFNIKKLQSTFLEIGAGAGLTSLLLLDQIPSSKVIICDLPVTICVGFTLVSHFAKEKYKIILPHEVTREALSSRLFDLAFITPNQTDLIDNNSIDGIINVHSMQEMEMNCVNTYFKLIKRISRNDAIFYCKNLDESKQLADNKMDNYAWDSIGITILDTIAEYATHVYGIKDRTVRVRIVKV